MKRRELLAAGLLGAGAASTGHAAPGGPPGSGQRTLRLALQAPETTFDPPQTNSDYYANQVIANIFEAPYSWDYLARPARMVPATAAGMPEVSADYKTIRITLKPGILFQPHPAFGGQPRELVAADYVYSVKRFFDPKINSSDLYLFEEGKLLGLHELRQRAIQTRQPFDYDTEVPGLRAVDRYTFEMRLGEPGPRFVSHFATAGLTGAVAREVVQYHGDAIVEHPIGTGAFMLGRWRRGSEIELVRSPTWRGEVYHGTPADTPEAQAAAAHLKGKTLPLVDRVVFSIIEQQQPRWLAFVGGEHDMIEVPSGSYTRLAQQGGRLAPFLARKGVRMQVAQQPDMTMTFFNCTDPVVGGNAPEKVALRRAVALAFDNGEYIRLVRGGLALPAHSVVAPHCSGYEAGYRSEMGEFSPAKANALLDLYGYRDRNGDGWRELPDGQPLTLRLGCMSSETDRASNELWQRCMQRVGIRIEFEVATWPELLKRARANALQMWGYGWTAGSPDGGFFLSTAYSPNANESNDARFTLPEYDRLYERIRVLADGPEREALMRQAKNLLVAYMPYKAHCHRSLVDLTQPWVHAYWRHPFMRDVCRFIDVEPRS
jgi:ABC-type transport system substrate-binding protein